MKNRHTLLFKFMIDKVTMIDLFIQIIKIK